MSEQELNQYELLLIFSPSLHEKEREKKINEVKELVSSAKGEIQSELDWGRKELAYTIKKEDVGHYYILNFNADPSEINEINQPLQLEPGILRYLLTIQPEKYQKDELTLFNTDEDFSNKKEEDSEEKKEEKPLSVPIATKSVEAEKPSPEKEEKEEVSPKTEEKKEEAPVKKEEKAAEKLDEVDEKLQQILDSPDITL